MRIQLRKFVRNKGTERKKSARIEKNERQLLMKNTRKEGHVTND